MVVVSGETTSIQSTRVWNDNPLKALKRQDVGNVVVVVGNVVVVVGNVVVVEFEVIGNVVVVVGSGSSTQSTIFLNPPLDF